MNSDAQILSAIRSIYDAAIEPARWPQVLQQIADCTGDVGAIVIYGRDDGSFGVIESPSLAAIVAEYREGWSLRDARANRARERGYFIARDVITDRDVLSPEEMESDPFYCDFLARHGLRYFAAAIVSPDPRVEVGVSVQRAVGRDPYSESELATVGLLGQHVEKSLRLSMAVMDARLINEGLAAALARMGAGVFVVDSLGRVVFSNPAAEHLVGDGLQIVDGRLRIATVPAQGDAGNALVPLAIDEASLALAETRPILVPRQGAERPLVLYMLPVTSVPVEAGQLLAHARVVVLVMDSDADSPPDPSVIRDVLGLTLGEARVASLVGSGVRPREVAGRLGIAEETVRTVLKRIFAKVGVSRQSELAALMTRLVLR